MINDLTTVAAGGGLVRLSWVSTISPPYRVYVDGRLAATVMTTTHTLPVAAGAVVDVLDGDEPPPAFFPDRIELTWLAVSEAERYRVTRLIDGEWRTVATLSADGRSEFRWTSPRLDDVTQHSFRVTAVGAGSGDDTILSTPVEFSFLMVRVPDPPAVTFTYHPGSGTVTVALAEE